MGVKVELALAEHRPRLKSLLSAYLSELAGYGDVDRDYPYFDSYWTGDAGRWPYLIRRDHQDVGFAFVNDWSPSNRGTDFAMAEFYIVAQARGAGVGREAAKAILQAHPGVWELSIMSANAPAHAFWHRVLAAADAEDMERIEGNGQTIYRFRIGWAAGCRSRAI